MAPNVFISSRCYGPFTPTIYYVIAIAITIRLKNRLCFHFSIAIAILIPIHPIEKNSNRSRAINGRCEWTLSLIAF